VTSSHSIPTPERAEPERAVPRISIKDVSLVRRERHILRNVSWEIGGKENWVLFGRNGSGKTMLLEVITGYLHPSSGEVIRFGLPHGEYDLRELRRRIGYVSTPLRTMFSPHERLVEVVLSGLYASVGLYTRPQKREEERAAELLDTIAMGERLGDPFGPLSDGEKQKVLMLRALISDPELLILDEPAEGLDIPSREDLLHSLEKLTVNGRHSIIYVTHHTEEITPLFTHIMILDGGSAFFAGLVREGLKKELLQRVMGRRLDVLELNNRYYTVLR
jgi:iron complex transport system ATP-binding protein